MFVFVALGKVFYEQSASFESEKSFTLFSYSAEWFAVFFLCVFGVIFISWSPFLIANYPGAIEWDAYHQIEQFLGVQELTNHWPVVSTFLWGAIVGGGIPLMQASSYAYLSKRQFVQCLLRIRFLYLRK